MKKNSFKLQKINSKFQTVKQWNLEFLFYATFILGFGIFKL